MKTKHILFAHHYLLTGDKDLAYKLVYPKAAGEPLKTAARRLINRPDVKTYIQQHLTELTEMALAKRM